MQRQRRVKIQASWQMWIAVLVFFSLAVLTPAAEKRVALPREYQPFVKESVRIEGPTQLEEIDLERVSKTELLPPTPEILSQLTGAEWLMNIPGTGEEKRVLTLACGFGCHSYQQIFRNRYDERSWRLIVQRMMRGAGSPIINLDRSPATSRDRFNTGRPLIGDEELLAKWLARVRGPESQDEPLYYLPRPRGAATRVVITEYELPRELLAPHDVSGDSKGNIWYTAHRSPYAGVLDPRTGIVKEYRIPEKEKDTPNALPGTHRVLVDKNDIVWFSENWDHYLTALDPQPDTPSSDSRLRAPPVLSIQPGLASLGWTRRAMFTSRKEEWEWPRLTRKPGRSFSHGPSKRFPEERTTASSLPMEGIGREHRLGAV